MNEIYGSSGGDSRPDHGDPSFGSSWGGPRRSDYSDYGSDVPGDHPDFDDGYETDPDTYTERYVDPADLAQGMTRREYAEYVRNQSPDSDGMDGEDNDADIDAILHENDHLPDPRTRQQAARDATLDEAPTLAEAANAPDELADAPDADHRGDHPYADGSDQRADHPDSSERSPDAVISQLGLRIADLEAANTTFSNGMAELGAKYTQQGEVIAELKSENKDLKSENADHKAEITELRDGLSALQASVEHLKQGSADIPAEPVHNKERSEAEKTDKKAGAYPDRKVWRSNEAIGLATMAGGTIATTVSDYWRYLPATYAGITASVLGVGATAVAFVRKYKEAKNAGHRPDH